MTDAYFCCPSLVSRTVLSWSTTTGPSEEVRDLRILVALRIWWPSTHLLRWFLTFSGSVEGLFPLFVFRRREHSSFYTREKVTETSILGVEDAPSSSRPLGIRRGKEVVVHTTMTTPVLVLYETAGPVYLMSTVLLPPVLTSPLRWVSGSVSPSGSHYDLFSCLLGRRGLVLGSWPLIVLSDDDVSLSRTSLEGRIRTSRLTSTYSCDFPF